MIRLHSLLLLLFLLASFVLRATSATPLASPLGKTTAPPYLNEIAQSKGKLWFGTATDIPGPEQLDRKYMTILNDTKIFGQLTPANYMKYEFTEPEQGGFNYTGGTVVLDIAEAHHKRVRCHNLVWVSELPEWVLNGNWTAESLTAVMKNHIYHLIQHWGDRCYSWDVVNEALADNGTWAQSVWFDTIGAEYFYKAYEFAAEAVKEAKLDVKLYYNDYNIEYVANKSTAAARLVKELQRRKIQIDGVGFESHFEVGLTPSKDSQKASMKMFTDLGIDVVQTEIDVRFTTLPYNATGLAMQATNYYDTVRACMETERCLGMTVWDFVDQFSWVPGSFPGEGGADLYGLYSSNYTRKPAYDAVGEALLDEACTACKVGS